MFLVRTLTLGGYGIFPRQEFLPLDGDFPGRLNSEANFVAADFQHRNNDAVTDDNFFVRFSGQNEHQNPSKETVLSKPS